jgi:two-component system, NtrC family, nitrogen regulation sensor histidine kinase NtrY
MIFKKYKYKFLASVLLLVFSIFLFCFLQIKYDYWYTYFIVFVIIYQVNELYLMLKKTQDELEDFVESVQYRDFTKQFNIQQSPTELRTLRKGFNEINATFKLISREKEAQFQYLQKVLEIVDTGIISYNIETGEMNWVNETFKKMVDIPYLKNIQSLEKRNELLYKIIVEIKPSESQLFGLEKKNKTVKTFVSAAVFVSEQKTNKIIAFQNINQAVEETEANAWQKLLSVMTHEIMNSIAPISSLADTLKNSVATLPQQLRAENVVMDDLEIGLETIKRRSQGLLKFAEVYRTLNKITEPNLKIVYIHDLFESLHNLMQPTLEEKNIELETILKNPQLTIELDTHLVEQVLINLILNASDALKGKENAKIILSGFSENGKNNIQVQDNGSGIAEDILENIFIPFFSTKKSGSGIGLSLSKQIMLLHKGSIQVNSVANQGSIFTLEFK